MASGVGSRPCPRKSGLRPNNPNKAATDEATAKENQTRSEADLRGILSNDSMTEEEKKQLEEDRARTEEAAKLRGDDYQLAYAVDILRGLAAVADKP